MTLDLSQFVGQRVYATRRNGDVIIAPLALNTDQDSDEYPYSLSNDNIAEEGFWFSDRRPHDLDIISIRPADSVTLLEWITDRRPTEEDAMMGGFVQSIDEKGRIFLLGYVSASQYSYPWTHCPGWTPPKPEPSKREKGLAALDWVDLRTAGDTFKEKLDEIRDALEEVK